MPDKDLQALQRALKDTQRLATEKKAQLRHPHTRKGSERATELAFQADVWHTVFEILRAVTETWQEHAYNVAPAVIQLAAKAKNVNPGNSSKLSRQEAYERAASILIRTGWATTDGSEVSMLTD